jgi:hypothetical protein
VGSWGGYWITSVVVKPGYLYFNGDSHIGALKFDGTTFTPVVRHGGIYVGMVGVWADGSYIYATDAFDGILGWPKCN